LPPLVWLTLFVNMLLIQWKQKKETNKQNVFISFGLKLFLFYNCVHHDSEHPPFQWFFFFKKNNYHVKIRRREKFLTLLNEFENSSRSTFHYPAHSIKPKTLLKLMCICGWWIVCVSVKISWYQIWIIRMMARILLLFLGRDHDTSSICSLCVF